MGNSKGNLQALGKGSSNQIKKERQTNKGHYKLAFIEPFSGVTNRDVEIKQEYAKDLISKYVGYPKDMIKFRKKSAKQTVLSLDEVFYVKIGLETVGKVSIRVQRTFKANNMTIIYQEKKLRAPRKPTKKKKGSRTKDTRRL